MEMVEAVADNNYEVNALDRAESATSERDKSQPTTVTTKLREPLKAETTKKQRKASKKGEKISLK